MISIIIPVYNVEDFLEECLQSIVRQSYDDFEVVMIDDGSTDRSSAICQKYCSQDNRFSYYYQSNSGVSKARNEGLKQISGDYITFMDADDYYTSKDALLILLENLKKYNVDVVSCGIENKYFRKSTYTVHRGILSSRDALKAMLLNEISVSACNKLYTKEVLEGIYFAGSYVGEDQPFLLAVFRKMNTMQNIDKILYTYRHQRAHSITKKASEQIVKIMDIKSKIYEEIIAIYPELAKYKMAYFSVSIMGLKNRADVSDNAILKRKVDQLFETYFKDMISDRYVSKKTKINALLTKLGLSVIIKKLHNQMRGVIS